jgi:hypothetical protein
MKQKAAKDAKKSIFTVFFSSILFLRVLCDLLFKNPFASDARVVLFHVSYLRNLL